jgi:hypothetical protein
MEGTGSIKKWFTAAGVRVAPAWTALCFITALCGRIETRREENVSPSSNPVGEIGSGYLTNVYNCNRLSLLILRQDGAVLTIDLPDGCCYGDQNTWKTFQVSEQKITPSNQTTNNQMKKIEANLK